MKFNSLSILLFLCLFVNLNGRAQKFDPGNIPADSWKEVSQQKKVLSL